MEIAHMHIYTPPHLYAPPTAPPLTPHTPSLLPFIIFLKLFIFEGGAERKGERIPSGLHPVSAEPDVGLDLTNRAIMTRAEIKSRMLNQLSHPGAPSSPSL